MVQITVSQDIKYDLAAQGGIVGSQPFKKTLKVDTLSDWKLTEKLNGLKVFEFSVKNDELEKANIFVERDIYVPLLTPFKGIITSKEPDKEKVDFVAHEDAWHFTRRKFKCHDKARLKYTNDKWYDKLWLRRRNLSVPEKFTKHIKDAFINVPILIKLTDVELKHHAKNDGSDIFFTVIENEEPLKLKHKIERYTPSTGELIAWVEFPEIRDSTLKFQMYFDNPEATSQQSTTTFDNFGYNGVWLLENSALDETSNNNDGTITGATYVSNGKIAGAYDFDGVNDKIEFPSDASHENIWRGSNYERDTIIINGDGHSGLNAAGAKVYYSKLIDLTPGDIITNVSIDIVTSSGNLRIKLYDHVNGKPTNLLNQTGSVSSPGTGIQDFYISRTTIPDNGIVYVAIEVDNDTISIKGNEVGSGSIAQGSAYSESHTYGTGPTTANASNESNTCLWSKVSIEPASGEGSSGGWCSAWFKARSDGEGNVGEIMRHEPAWGLRTTTEAGESIRLQFFHTCTGTDALWRHNVVTPVSLNEWHRADIIFNKSNIENSATLYLDGVLDSTFVQQQAGTQVFDSDTGGVHVIGNASATTETFDGEIDTVKIHNNPPGNIEDLITLEYQAESNPEFIVIGQMEHYLEQADIIAKDILGSANQDMPVIDTTQIPDLLSLYRLNGDAFDSNGSIDGTWTGTETYSNDSIFFHDKSGKFDGSSYITMGSSSDFGFEISDPFTISFWVKFAGGSISQAFVQKDNQISGASPAPFLVWYAGASTKTVIFNIVSSTANYQLNGVRRIDDDKWHFVTVTHADDSDRGSMRIWIDGRLDSKGVDLGMTGSTVNTEVPSIGATSTGGAKFTGKLDDVRFYDRELSEEEIKKLYEMTQSDTTNVRKMVQWKLGDGHSTYIPNTVSIHKLDQSLLDSKGDHDGFVIGTEQYITGKYKSAFNFLGTGNRVVLKGDETDYDFDRTDEFTVMCWVKNTQATGNRMFVGKGLNLTSSKGWYLFQNSGTAFFNLVETNTTNEMRKKGVARIDDGEWHHVAVVKTTGTGAANEVTIYIDGVDDGATNQVDSLTTGSILTDYPVTFGDDADGNQSYTGGLDDVRIFNRALSALEIKRIAESTGSFIDDPRDDDIPTESISVNFEHKNHLESLKKIAKAVGKDLFFDSVAHRVYIKNKGKEIKEKFANMKISKPQFKLDNVANIINVVGNDKSEGVQREKTFEDTNDLKYNYEKTIANKQIATDNTLDSVGAEILTSLKDLTPDLSISTTPDQYNKFDLQVGDTLNISELKQDLQGKFKIIKIEANHKNVKLSLSEEKNQSIQTSGKDLASILSNLISSVQDLNITPED